MAAAANGRAGSLKDTFSMIRAFQLGRADNNKNDNGRNDDANIITDMLVGNGGVLLVRNDFAQFYLLLSMPLKVIIDCRVSLGK